MELKHITALNYIIRWINYRLIEKQYCKNSSGIYIWSSSYSIGKTYLARVLSQIFKVYFWVYRDKEWQQGWLKGSDYECIIYNAINGADLIPFDQVENHGDCLSITVPKRNNRIPDKVKPYTPFMMNSNRPPEDLGYSENYGSIDAWKERMLTVCVNDCPLFPLTERLIKMFNVKIRKDDPKPVGIDFWEI